MVQPTNSAQALSVNHLQLIESKVSNERKSVALAYVLWFFLGLWGVHNFYLSKIKLAFFQMLGGVISVGVLINAVAQSDAASPDAGRGFLIVLSTAILIVWILSFFVDMFLIPGRARKYSEGLRQRYAAELSASTPTA